MKSSGCPPWIDPGNAFRIVVDCVKYTANLDYGSLEMEDSKYEVWFDCRSVFTLTNFVEEMASNIIWGTSQQLIVWGVDRDSGTECKVSTDKQFVEMVGARLEDKLMHVACEVMEKGQSGAVGHVGSAHATSGVTAQSEAQSEAVGDTVMSPEAAIDWSTLTIIPNDNQDGEATMLADEDAVFEALGFKAAEEEATFGSVGEDYFIPSIPTEIQQEMEDTAIPVDDNAISEPIIDWDRDNPDMEVGAVYPSMPEFRLAVRQHAIVEEFELHTEKSDKKRFRGCCSANGCPWRIRARTQHDNSVRVQINDREHNCASVSRVVGRMTFSVQKFQAAYAGVIPNITDRNQWPQVDKGFKLQPPVAKMKKKTAGRDRKKRLLSCLERTGKATRQAKCDGCGELGHRRGSSNCPLTGTKKRKRTTKTKTKVGRKKSSEASTSKEPSTPKPAPNTPRTRAAVAREAAALAAEAAISAAVAAAVAEQGVAAVQQPAPIPDPPAKRKLPLDDPPAKKMTPRKKKLASKIKIVTPTKN